MGEVCDLIMGLVKSGTKKPMEKSSVMLRQPFIEILKKLSDNEELSFEDLRLKTLTSVALCLMLCPLDVAPRAVKLENGVRKNIQFTAEKIKETSDRALSLYFFGIRNDYD